jgi:kinesin family protein 6/9
VTLKEATFINKSLSFLEQVVIALSSSHRDHIPYRQSRLTNLLRDSLGGNCKTVMVANIWPEGSHLEETLSTLKFATRMMRVSNDATVNVTLDKHLMIKRYEKEIRDLKQELAMHDTLKNRGRITYDHYPSDMQADIKQHAMQFLAGEVDELTDFDSLRKVREYFAQIRNLYRRLKQNIEAVQRQLETDPAAAQKALADAKKPSSTELGASGQPVHEDEHKEGEKKKRAPIDKQTAFLEYKTFTEEGKALESAIVQYREDIKDKKLIVKNLTATINATKQELDRVSMRLQQKKDENHAAHARDAQFDEDEGFSPTDQGGLVIDEEELTLYREQKDLKRSYRDNFDKLKQAKVAIADATANIDGMKQQIVFDFERWYAEEFEGGGADAPGLSSTLLTY